MPKRKLPKKLNDGQYDYVLVQPERELPDGRAFVALYERQPRDPDRQYTPDLAYCQGQTDTPVMHGIAR